MPEQHKRSWQKRRQQARTLMFRRPTREHQLFLTTLYEKRIPPSLLPSEAGIPLPSHFLIATPAFMWQTWILLDHIMFTREGNHIALEEIWERFMSRVAAGQVKYRQMPLLQGFQEEQPVLEYLESLCTLGVLEEVSEGTYEKKSPIMLPTSLEYAYRRDGEVLEVLFPKKK